jgi:hypothetical protein
MEVMEQKDKSHSTDQCTVVLVPSYGTSCRSVVVNFSPIITEHVELTNSTFVTIFCVWDSSCVSVSKEQIIEQ